MESVVQQQYDHLAKIYDRRWYRYVISTLDFLKQWAKIHPQATVLDIACGTGEFERLLLADSPHQQIVGIDLSSKMLAIAQRKLELYSTVSFKQGSVTDIPVTSEHFDVVVCASAFHYFDQPLQALTEMKRTLKPGGKLIILDWCKDFFLCRLYDTILKFFDPAYQGCYTQQELHQFLADAGFEIQAATKQRIVGTWGLMAVTATKDEHISST